MKLLIKSTVLLFIFFTNLPAQMTVAWQKSYGGTNRDFCSGLTFTPDKGYLIGSYTNSNNKDVSGNNGDYDFWLTKVGTIGELAWQKCIGGTLADGLSWVINTSDGGFAAVGNTYSNGAKGTSQVHGYHGGQDVYFVKTSSTGAFQFSKSLGGCDKDEARMLAQTKDGGFIIVGGTWSNTGDVYGYHGDWDSWVLKLDAQGNIEWQKPIGGSGIDYFFSVNILNDGTILLGGLSSSTDGDVKGVTNQGVQDFWVVKLNPAGDILWQKLYGGTAKEEVRDIGVFADGNILLVGHTYSSNGNVTNQKGEGDIWLVCTDPSGNMLWQKTYGGSFEDLASDVVITKDQKIVVIGSTKSLNGDVLNQHGGSDTWVLTLDKAGKLLAQYTWGGSKTDIGKVGVEGNDNEIAVVSISDSFDGDVTQNYGDLDVWLTKFSIKSVVSTGGNNEKNIHFSVTPSLTSGMIRINSSIDGDKVIRIYNSAGYLIKESRTNLANETIDVGAMPSGNYIVHLITEDGSIGKARFVKM